MKEENKGEKIVLIIVILIVLFVIGYLLYNVFISKKNLLNNEYDKPFSNHENNSNQTNNNNTTNTEGSSNQETHDKEIQNEDSHIPQSPKNEKKEESKKEEEIATYSTSIYDKDENRVSNITLANSKLNDVIIKNGEEFSYNNTIGPMNEAQGFKKALGFDSKGKKIQISGGGLCQISSTLYNAVMAVPNLEIIERHPHSNNVPYVKKDKDAAVAYGSYDFKFKNNTGNDIRILASVDSSCVTTSIWTIPK